MKKLLFLLRKKRFDAVFYKIAWMLKIRKYWLKKPYLLAIEPTNTCNLHCPTCPTGAGKMNRPACIMSFEAFKNIIDPAKDYICFLLLWHYGEPFLNPELLKMINYAASSGIHTTVSTNGHFFRTKEFCRDVVKSGLEYLIICLDGLDQETITKFRKGAVFSEILDGFKFIKEAKAELGSKTPIVELQFIVMKHNEHQRAQARILAKELGVDVYREKPVGIDCLDPDFQKMVKEFLPSDASISGYCVDKNGSFVQKGRPLNICPFITCKAMICCDGSLVPCCYDLYSEYIMGNVFKEDLLSIWKSDNYRKFRERIFKDRSNINICNACPEARQAK